MTSTKYRLKVRLMNRTAKLTIAALLLISALMLTIISGCESKKYVVGVVNPNDASWGAMHAFIKHMEELGYKEGNNITYIYAGNYKTLKTDITDMVNQNVDMILTMTNPAAKMAKKVTKGMDVPVLFILFDPVDAGIINSIKQPAGNLTGIKVRGSTQKSLEKLLQLKPGIKNIHVPIAFDTKAARQSLKDLRQAASKLKVTLTVAEVTNREELLQNLTQMPEDIDAIFILRSILVSESVQDIVEAAKKRRIPTAAARGMYKQGVTITFGAEFNSMGAQASRLADKLLKGTKPRMIPIEACEYYLGLNLKTASESGIEIPDELLNQADYIIR